MGSIRMEGDPGRELYDQGRPQVASPKAVCHVHP